jgi:hypothetical protein
MVFLLELKKHKQIVRSYNNPATDLPHSIKKLEMKNGEMKIIKEGRPNNITIKKSFCNENEMFIF